MRLAAYLAQRELNVAHPLWNDDVVDALIMHVDQGQYTGIPVQLKSVQFSSPSVQIQSLTRKYVDETPQLCLLIEDVDRERYYFVPGAEEIRRLFAAQQAKKRSGGKNWTDIAFFGDVPLRVQRNPAEALQQWLIPKGVENGALFLRRALDRLRQKNNPLREQLKNMPFTVLDDPSIAHEEDALIKTRSPKAAEHVLRGKGRKRRRPAKSAKRRK